MSTTKTPIEQAQERYPDPQQQMAERLGLIPDYKRRRDFIEAYAACLEERAIPAEEALRVAMEYIKSLKGHYSTSGIADERAAYDALLANPITAKMLEE